MMHVGVYWVLCILLLVTDAGHSLGLNEDANVTVTGSCIENERQALLEFKANIKDIDDTLYDWRNEEEKRDCCKWVRVSCSNLTGHITALDLYGNFVGKISPSLKLLKQLQHLDLSGNDFQLNHIPNFFGSLTNLEYLDMFNANLSGPIPHELGNLSGLFYIDLSGNYLVGSIPFYFGALTSLATLDLSNNQLENVIPHQLGNLSNLVNLDFSGNSLRGYIPFSFRALTSLIHLDLSINQLRGVIPHQIGNLSNLSYLDLTGNSLVGSIPFSFGALTSLQALTLSKNLLTGPVPNFGGWSSLASLSLDHNSLSGSIPDFAGCESLQVLDLSGNQLSGDLPNSVGHISNLVYLDVSSNSLNCVISDPHFNNLSRLTYLDMSFNSFSFELSSHFRFPFQLETINLQSCNLGPRFPMWIKSQKNFKYLDISSAGISDSVPVWFWDLPFGLKFLNLSSNKLKGTLPDITSNFDEYPGLDLSNNCFEGRVPLFPFKLASLDISGNKFTGNLSFLCHIDGELTFIDLSNNLFSGSLPDCWSHFQKLVILDLSNNHLFGNIPMSFRFLYQLEALYLRKNAFVGELPMSLSNCTNLRFVDLGENKLSCTIPEWVGERLTGLYCLILRSNMFSGSLPPQICWLYNLHILDLSRNGLMGDIPRCFGNFTSMFKKSFKDDMTNHYYSQYTPNGGYHDCNIYNWCQWDNDVPAGVYEQFLTDNALVVWKGAYRSFGSSLKLLKSIDLSDNNLSGNLPCEITHLVELVSLNFSLNKMYGELPRDIGQLRSLDALDLSRNQFFGNIPSSLSQVHELSYLNLSFNNFSGRIPTGTQLQSFTASSYEGNPLLYGLPLTRTPSTVVENEEDEKYGHDNFWISYYMGMGIGFAVGFWGTCGAIFLNRRCRHLLFASLSLSKDWICVTVVVLFRKLKRFYAHQRP